MNLFFQPLCCLASCHFSLLYSFPWFLSITDMGQLLRIISNADISDCMSHMVCHLGLAEFPLPPCPMVCRCVMNDPLACLFPHRQFNQRNRKESINPCTMSVSLGGLSLLISLNPSVQPLGSPDELTCLDSAPHRHHPAPSMLSPPQGSALYKAVDVILSSVSGA